MLLEIASLSTMLSETFMHMSRKQRKKKQNIKNMATHSTYLKAVMDS